MSAFLDLISLVTGDKATDRGWVAIVTIVFVLVGGIGLAGAAGHIPVDLEPFRNRLGGFGSQLVYWHTLFIGAGIWFIALFPLGIYFRLRDSSIGKPD